MVRKIKFVLGLFFIISVYSCLHNPSKTDVFKTYLKEKFSRSLVKSDHYYIVIPEYGCKGCMKQITKHLMQALMDEHDKITWILSNKDTSFNQLLDHYDLLIDHENDIERSFLSIASITVIFVSEGQIRYVNNIYTKNDAEHFIKKIKFTHHHPN